MWSLPLSSETEFVDAIWLSVSSIIQEEHSFFFLCTVLQSSYIYAEVAAKNGVPMHLLLASIPVIIMGLNDLMADG